MVQLCVVRIYLRCLIRQQAWWRNYRETDENQFLFAGGGDAIGDWLLAFGLFSTQPNYEQCTNSEATSNSYSLNPGCSRYIHACSVATPLDLFSEISLNKTVGKGRGEPGSL